MQNELNILYKNGSSAPDYKPNQLAESSVSQGVTSEPNLCDVQSVTGFTPLVLSEFLPEVTDKEIYEQLLDGVDPAVVEGAIELVSVEIREHIQGFYQQQEWKRRSVVGGSASLSHN